MIKQLSTKVVYTNPWISVREDEVEFANGHKGVYGVVDSQNFMLVVPFDGDIIDGPTVATYSLLKIHKVI